MPEIDANKRSERDAQGRWLPGRSGNPAGRGPGRPSAETDRLADLALAEVLQHDLRLMAEPETRANWKKHELARDRVARMCGRRLLARAEVSSGAAEVPRGLPPEIVDWLLSLVSDMTGSGRLQQALHEAEGEVRGFARRPCGGLPAGEAVTAAEALPSGAPWEESDFLGEGGERGPEGESEE
jgi:hypothetical protein